jgi:signal transduction histidine kinase
VDEALTRRDNACVSRWSRALVYAGIVLGGVALLATVWHILVADRRNLGASLSWTLFGVAPIYSVAVWLVRKRPEHPQTRRLLLLGMALAINVGIEGPIAGVVRDSGPPPWLWLANLTYQFSSMLALIAAVLLLASYPDGVVERRWQRGALRAMWLHLALPPLLLLSSPTLAIDRYLLNPTPVVRNPVAVSWLSPLSDALHSLYFGYIGGLAVLTILFVRFVQGNAEQRARMRMLVYVTAALIPVYGLQLFLANRTDSNSILVRVVTGLGVVLLLMVPVTIVVGIIRYRLFEIDLVLRRSMVFGILSLGIALVYFGLAAAPGLALGNDIPVELAVGLTIVAAVVFQPLRRHLERLADRMVFGERVNRYQLLTTFGTRLEQAVDLSDLVPRLAETVHRGLAASWVRVSLPGAHGSAGEASGDPALVVPLERGGEIIGRIECGAKEGGYQPGDYELLATLAGQAATAIANVQLTARLGERVAELARSRARIIAAEDTERRRIERNIHDGAQQQVVALIMKLRLARNQLSRGDRPLAEVFDELQSDARELLADLRELAHGIHPPVLSDRGLVAAVEARAARLPLSVKVHASLDLHDHRFDPDIEGAAYYVVCEALTNVVKHASASSTAVTLSTSDGSLSVLVHDNGSGLIARNGHGQGLTNLRDRVEALGGTIDITGLPGSGTTVHALLPVGAPNA